MTRVAGYSQPASQLPGAQTVVTNPDGTQPGETNRGIYKERGLPSPPNKREKPLFNPHLNAPSDSGNAPGGKNLHEDRVRTKGTPGQESPPANEEPTETIRRRPGLHASDEVDASMVAPGPRVPLNKNRQKKQVGRAKRYYKRYYQKNQKKIKRRMTRWYQRNRRRFNYKKDQWRRREYPTRFKRKPGGYDEAKDRSREWREEKGQERKKPKDKLEKKSQLILDPPIWFVYLPTNDEGVLLSVNPDGGTATVAYATEMDWLPEQDLELEDFLTKTLIPEESDIDRLMSYFDQAFEWQEGEDEDDGTDDPDLEFAFNEWVEGRPFSLPKRTDEELAQRVAARCSEMFYEKRPVEGNPSDYYNRGSEPYSRQIDQSGEPANVLDRGQVDNNPGSAKVIPEGHDFENKNDRKDTLKVALRIAEIEESCAPGLRQRSEGIPLRMTRSDPKNLMWLFDVKGSKESYRVRVKAVPKGNVSDINKVDIRVSCTCPFWRWQGPEHWAKSKDYLYGKPKGSATRPDTKDPSGRHGACKHVLAVLKRVSGFMWPKQLKEAPGKTASLRYLADSLRFGRILVTHEGMESMISSVSRRYVRRVTRRTDAHI